MRIGQNGSRVILACPLRCRMRRGYVSSGACSALRSGQADAFPFWRSLTSAHQCASRFHPSRGAMEQKGRFAGGGMRAAVHLVARQQQSVAPRSSAERTAGRCAMERMGKVMHGV